jgi:hypothetical protein
MLPPGGQAELRGLGETSSQVEAAGSAFRGPVLVMSRAPPATPAPFDVVWSQAQADLVARHGGAWHETAPGGGHYVHRDQQTWFVTQARRFILAEGQAR